VLLAVPLGAVVKILVSRATEAYLRSLYYRQIPPTSTPTPLPGARIVDENTPPTQRPEAPPKLAGEPLVGQKFPTPLSVRIEQGRG
jgi:hypothetical protein